MRGAEPVSLVTGLKGPVLPPTYRTTNRDPIKGETHSKGLFLGVPCVFLCLCVLSFDIVCHLVFACDILWLPALMFVIVWSSLFLVLS